MAEDGRSGGPRPAVWGWQKWGVAQGEDRCIGVFSGSAAGVRPMSSALSPALHTHPASDPGFSPSCTSTGPAMSTGHGPMASWRSQ